MEKAYSISTLEQALKKLRASDIKSKSTKSKYNQIKQQLNKLYAENKNQIIEFEKTNYSYLALIRSTNNFYKMFEHSALFYVNSIAPKLNLKANLQTDGDFIAKSEVGFVSIRELDKLTEALATIKIAKVKTKDQTGDFLLYKLPWTFTEDQLTDYIENNHFKMRKFNHIVLIDNSIPVLFIQLEELTKAIYENVRGLPGPVEREAFGHELIRQSISTIHTYLDLANGNLDKLTCLKSIHHKINFIKYQTKILADLKIWQPKVCARIGEHLIQIQDIITRELKSI